ncbi:hypothetical protein WG66_009209 [Moniliophthora roreri]|nr:hypothetical protein WG66_009209 [Moniliophthora roreri]
MTKRSLPDSPLSDLPPSQRRNVSGSGNTILTPARSGLLNPEFSQADFDKQFKMQVLKCPGGGIMREIQLKSKQELRNEPLAKQGAAGVQMSRRASSGSVQHAGNSVHAGETLPNSSYRAQHPHIESHEQALHQSPRSTALSRENLLGSKTLPAETTHAGVKPSSDVQDMLGSMMPKPYPQLNSNSHNQLPSPVSPNAVFHVPKVSQDAISEVATATNVNCDTRPHWFHELPSDPSSVPNAYVITQRRAEAMFCAYILEQGYSCLSLRTLPTEVTSRAWEAVERTVRHVLDPLPIAIPPCSRVTTPVPALSIQEMALEHTSSQETAAESSELVYLPSPSESEPPLPTPPKLESESLTDLQRIRSEIQNLKSTRARLDENIRKQEVRFSAARDAEKDAVLCKLQGAWAKYQKMEKDVKEMERRLEKVKKEIEEANRGKSALEEERAQIVHEAELEKSLLEAMVEAERAQKKWLEDELDKLR